MKIDTRIDEGTAGLIFKKTVYTLVFNIQFTEEELAQIRKLGLTKDPHNVLVSGVKGQSGILGEIALSQLLNGGYTVSDFEDLGHVKSVQSHLIDALKNLKAYLTEATDTGTKSIEL